ncbi:uncharacterized protein LOC127242662 [Andrographis paniculata]|uniref:uncharacterized protein LOC127242662 n=1 Tax=Andrographis paniculata TaxID=175694 RepID=UPI0021E87956|nr:uncharacterized protein LOC127242662 [Andrographis paniculata]
MMEKGGRRRGKRKEDEVVVEDKGDLKKTKRSPLQDLNGKSISKIHRKNSSNPSSSTSISSVGASRGSSRLFPSSISCSSSSSARTLIDKKPRDSSKLGRNSSKISTRSEENEQLLQKSKAQCWRNPTKSIGNNRSKPPSRVINPWHNLKKAPRELQVNTSNSTAATAEDSTPAGKVNSDGHNHVRETVNPEKAASIGTNSGSDAKTPPVEASVSPEIQRHTNSKMLIMNSAMAATPTPVCYGAGHLISGVTDNRKCRRRGSLRGGSERANLFAAETDPSLDSAILLPAEASVRWLLSPCHEGREDHTNERLGQCKTINNDDDLNTPDLLSSPSLLCGNISDLLSGDSCCIDEKIRDKYIVDSVKEETIELKGLSGDDSLLASTPGDLIGGISVDLLGSGNMIQTPTSESSLDSCLERSRFKPHCSKNTISPELDSIAEALRRVDLSCGVPDWESDPAFDATGLSQMKISWRDGLVIRDEENDEFDCCCLSDEEIDTDNKSPKEAKLLGNDSGKSIDTFPIISEYEPCISARDRGKFPASAPDTCAESICTNGGSLVASGDSDWTCSLDHNFFRVK